MNDSTERENDQARPPEQDQQSKIFLNGGKKTLFAAFWPQVTATLLTARNVAAVKLCSGSIPSSGGQGDSSLAVERSTPIAALLVEFAKI